VSDGSVKILEIVKHYTEYSVEKVVSAVNSRGDVFKVHNIGKESFVSKVIKVRLGFLSGHCQVIY